MDLLGFINGPANRSAAGEAKAPEPRAGSTATGETGAFGALLSRSRAQGEAAGPAHGKATGSRQGSAAEPATAPGGEPVASRAGELSPDPSPAPSRPARATGRPDASLIPDPQALAEDAAGQAAQGKAAVPEAAPAGALAPEMRTATGPASASTSAEPSAASGAVTLAPATAPASVAHAEPTNRTVGGAPSPTPAPAPAPIGVGEAAVPATGSSQTPGVVAQPTAEATRNRQPDGPPAAIAAQTASARETGPGSAQPADRAEKASDGIPAPATASRAMADRPVERAAGSPATPPLPEAASGRLEIRFHPGAERRAGVVEPPERSGDRPPAAPPPATGARSMPELPELPVAAAGGSGPAVRTAVMQALAGSEPVGIAASAAAGAPSSPMPGQAPLSALPTHMGGAETARAVAPQIATAIRADPGSGRIELRLDPPELGNVEISLEITDQSLRATLAAERPATNELLRRHGEILLTQLQQAGFTGIDLQFSTRHGNGRPAALPWQGFGGGTTLPPGEVQEISAAPAARRGLSGLDLRL